MSMLTLYFLVKLDAIVSMFGWLIASVVISGIIFFIYKLVEISGIADKSYSDSPRDVDRKVFDAEKKALGEKEIANMKKGVKKFAVATFACVFLFVMTPNTKEVAFIYVVGKLSQTSQVQNMAKNTLNIAENVTAIPDKAVEILNIKMNEYLNEFKSEAEQAAKDTAKEAVKEAKEAVKK